MKPPADNTLGAASYAPSATIALLKKTCIFIPAILMHFDVVAGTQPIKQRNLYIFNSVFSSSIG